MAHFDPPKARTSVHQSLMECALSLVNLAGTAAVLQSIDKATSETCSLHLLAAARFPVGTSNHSSLEIDKTIFMHPSAPKGWFEQYVILSKQNLDPGLMLARIGLAPFTWTENRHRLDPIGGDRWPYELASKFGMRDGFTCPVGGRWVLVYWSNKVIKDLSNEDRALLQMLSTFAAIRLEQLAKDNIGQIGGTALLTARELSVLRLLSIGKRTKAIADHLGIGEETVVSHIKKSQLKLGARNRVQAVAEALRNQLLP